MQHIALEATPHGSSLSKGERKRLRQSGQVFASLYGKGMETTAVTVAARDLVRVLSAEGGANTLVDLTINGQRHLVKLIELEVEPITRTMLHVGLHKILASDPQKATLTIHLTGEPETVGTNEAVLETGALSVDVKALPEKMIPSLEVDVSGMQIGDLLHAADLKLPAGFELLTSPETPIVALKAKREVAEPEELEAATAEEQELANGASSAGAASS